MFKVIFQSLTDHLVSHSQFFQALMPQSWEFSSKPALRICFSGEAFLSPVGEHQTQPQQQLSDKISFNLGNRSVCRAKPAHMVCSEGGVCFPHLTGEKEHSLHCRHVTPVTVSVPVETGCSRVQQYVIFAICSYISD